MPGVATVLIVEAEPVFAAALRERLEQRSLDVEIIGRGADALARVDTISAELLVVDRQLPDVSGPALCAALRNRCAAPILVVNAKRRRITRISLWNAGADAFVNDPARLDEIAARGRALIRRAHTKPDPPPPPILEVGTLRLDPRHQRVWLDGQPLSLPRREFQVLEALMRAQGRVLSPQTLFDQLWARSSPSGDPRTVSTHLVRLRKRLEAGDRPRVVAGVRDVGYKLISDVPESTNHQDRSSNGTANPQIAGSAHSVPDLPAVLLIEADESLIDAVRGEFKKQGYRLHIARDGAEGTELLDQVRPDLVLLDATLPLHSGIDVCRKIRTRSAVPIIIIGTNASETHVVVGLEVGADDYVIKPFDLSELMARVRALLRRSAAPAIHPASENSIDICGLRLDAEHDAVQLRGMPIALSRKEFALLKELMTNAGHVVTRSTLLKTVWGLDYVENTNTLNVHIKRLRARIEDTPARPTRIKTVRGVGYRFEVPRNGRTRNGR